MSKNKFAYKVENGVLYKAEIPKVPRINKGPCYYCELPVYVSEGQLLKFVFNKPTHKKCRK